MYHDKFWKYIKGKRQVGNVVNNVITTYVQFGIFTEQKYILFMAICIL